MRFGWLLVALWSCAKTPAPGNYHLVVSSAFSDAQSKAIFDAATEWETRSGRYVTFDGATDYFATIHVDLATSAQLTAEFGGGTIGLDTAEGASSHIELLEGLDDETFHQTALHELGHAIGLAHMTPGNVMCADTTCATVDVRCGDLQQLTGRTVTGCIP